MALSEDSRKALLAIARAVLEALDQDEQPVLPFSLSEELQQHCGAFVTLRCHGELRGCIGMITSDEPLAVTVSDMAYAAATRDPRFTPLSAAEAACCTIEISVMTPPQIQTVPEAVEVGRHGLIITRGRKRGLLLPQVAAEYHWDRETFLRHTCEKAGLLPEAWKEPGTLIETFEAEIIEEIE